MRGNINEIKFNYYGKKTFGYIWGEDNNKYFFHKNDLINCNIFNLEEGDSVEFEPSSNEKGLAAIRVRQTSVSQIETKVNPGINPSVNLSRFNDEEKNIIDFLGKVFYVTNGGTQFSIGQSMYSYVLVKPTTEYSHLFNIRREIVVTFSDYVPFEPRSLDVAGKVYESLNTKLRLDRSCHILISRDKEIETHLSEVLKDQNVGSVVVPFSYSELLNCKSDQRIVETRFRKYLFDSDLFATSKPIVDDNFFFGRRDFVLDITAKCKRGENCGVFGLRRSGKTSLLLAVERQLKRDGYETVFLPCESELRQLNWKSALHRIVERIKVEIDAEQSITHSEDDYKKNRASNYFDEDMRDLLKGRSKPIR